MQIRFTAAATVAAAIVALLGCKGDPGKFDYDGDGVVDSDDCEPEDPDIYPGAFEDCLDGEDNDCDGNIDGADTDCADQDGDGYAANVDCNDNNPYVNTGADEDCDDGIDNDCDEAIDDADTDCQGGVDSDGDGYDSVSSGGDDCDDNDADVNPGEDETTCDGIDNDCDDETLDEPDGDGDGDTVCDDCNDGDALLNTSDTDSDGYSTCDVEPDCNDNDNTSYPGATETCDGLDNDCDGTVPADENDADGDTYRVCEGDCDDGVASTNPGATETCNGVDDDCSGTADDTAACAPTITSIDGSGSALAVNDVNGETNGVPNLQPVQHRFQETWTVAGTYLDTVYDVTLDDGQGTVFTGADGLEFEQGGTAIERTLNLPAALIPGALTLTLTNSGGNAVAQVFLLQGEPGLACWDSDGDGTCDEPDEGGGDGCDASDCQGPDGPQGVQGDQGIPGVQGDPGQDGADGGNCWDLIGDANGDGYIDADDCMPGESDCPSGYDVIDTSTAGGAICQHPVSGDEMVQVGGFWIDRYEISIWSDAECTTGQKGSGSDDYDGEGFPDNGNWSSPLFACSVTGVTPSRYMTWFQAQQACELSGKDLCTNEQWQAAASGTTVPGCNTNGAGGDEGCNGSPDPWTTGDTQCGGCESAWGAVDMVGNLWEWAADWQQAGMTRQSSDGQEANGVWGADYGDDSTWNVNGASHNGTAYTDGLPAAAVRGGNWGGSSGAGVFALYLSYGPSRWSNSLGARCCRQQ